MARVSRMPCPAQARRAVCLHGISASTQSQSVVLGCPSHHAAFLLDQAGWRLSGQVKLPVNITLLVLQPKCPELNVMGNIWQFMRDNWLSNRVFRDHDGICRPLLPRLDQPDRTAAAHLFHRRLPMGPSVLISRKRR
jgi:hypothetical protein